MDGIVGILAVAGGFGLALGVTALGVHFVLAMVPQRARRVPPAPGPIESGVGTESAGAR